MGWAATRRRRRANHRLNDRDLAEPFVVVGRDLDRGHHADCGQVIQHDLHEVACGGGDPAAAGTRPACRLPHPRRQPRLGRARDRTPARRPSAHRRARPRDHGAHSIGPHRSAGYGRWVGAAKICPALAASWGGGLQPPVVGCRGSRPLPALHRDRDGSVLHRHSGRAPRPPEASGSRVGRSARSSRGGTGSCLPGWRGVSVRAGCTTVPTVPGR